MSHDLYRETVPFDPEKDTASAVGSATAVSQHISAECDAAAANQLSGELANGLSSQPHANGPVLGTTAKANRKATQQARKPRRGRRDHDNGTALHRPGDTIDHYELIRELGRGGMGVVFLARDLKLARRVAIKFIQTQCPMLAERFMVEAQTTARCHHENIVIIHDIGEHVGNPYMVLEYLRGHSLRELSAGKALSPERAIELMIPVARALKRAHAYGIVHRDLKPENIVVTESGTVKVLDFGIAKVFANSHGIMATGEHSGPMALTRPPEGSAQLVVPPLSKDAQTKTGAMIGTLPYMSPEQLCDSADVDQRTDIWTVGIILYELMLGRHPLMPLDNVKLESVAEVDEPMPSVAELVPHAGKLGDLIERCLIKRRDDRLATARDLVADLEALAARGASTKRLSPEDSPFAGLATFQKADADRFYGRTREIASVISQVQSQPLVTLVGPSGAGKSSLVRAGVIPALERAGEGWHALVVRPGRDPLAALGRLLGELQAHISTEPEADKPGTPGSVRGHRPATKESAGTAQLYAEPGCLGQALRDWARRKHRRVLLFIDQFEELYTLVPASRTRTAFLRCLEGAADDASSPLRVILTIRSDFLDRVVEDSQFMNEVTRGLVLVPPMDRAGLGEALTKPVEAAGYCFESAELVTEMLDALEGTAGALPLLQFAANKLWETRDRERNLLTTACYQSFGGIAGALAVHGDAVLASMSPAKLRIARGVFEHLVTPERTRAVATLGELRELPGDSDTIEDVINYLANARLLAIESDAERKNARAVIAQHPRGGRSLAEQGDDGMFSSGLYLGADSSTVELIHESLIESWPTLRSWLDDRTEDAEFLARLRVAARQWHEGARREGMLWTGEAAREAQRWHQRYGGELGARDRAYLEAVFANLGRTNRIKRYAIVGTIAFLSLLLVATAIGLWRIQQAESRASRRLVALKQTVARETAMRQEAQTARQEAERAQHKAERAQHEAERAQHEAEHARQVAEHAKAEAEVQAEAARQALAAYEAARDQAQKSTHAARQAAAKAKTAQATAAAERARAAKEQNKAKDEAEHKKRVIERAVGKVKRALQ